MALANRNAAAQAPAFETPETTAGATVVDQPAASVPAVVKPAGLPAIGGTFKLALLDKQEVLTISDVEAIGFGTFPRVTADLGGLMLDDLEIGKTMTVELMSWNLRYLATTNDNSEEGKKLVRTSYDNATISGGEEGGQSLADYVAALKAKGYDKASVKVYADLWGMMISNEKQGTLPEPMMVNISVSPDSLKQFKRYQLEQGIKDARSGTSSPILVINTERREAKGNRWGVMLFAPAPAVSQ